MNQLTLDPAVVDHRGLVLVAHYNFRKYTASRSGDAKGQSTAAAQQFRQSQDSADLHNVAYNVKVLGRVGTLIDLVGPPSEVPYEGLTQFLLSKHRQLHDAYITAFQELVTVTELAAEIAPTLDPRADAMQAVAISQGIVDAHMHVLQSFHQYFGPVLRQLNGK